MIVPFPTTDLMPAATGPAAICVVIVNYGTADLAMAAVESVLASRCDRRVEVHLLDNASPRRAARTDAEVFASAHADRGWGDRVTLYAERSNHGFGRGNNVVLRGLAARAVPPAYVMLLNQDAVLENGAIARLAAALDNDPSTAMVGAGISNPGGDKATAAFRFPNPLGEFAQAACFGPITRKLGQHIMPMSPDHVSGPVDWVAGAAVMARFDVLRQIDFFDPAFFLYYEEVDLMHRIRKAGWSIRYVGEARVIHAEGASTGVTSTDLRRRRPAYWYHSWYHYYVKHHGRFYTTLAGTAWLTGAAFNHAIARLRRQTPNAALNLFGDFWAMAGRPLLGLEQRTYE